MGLKDFASMKRTLTAVTFGLLALNPVLAQRGQPVELLSCGPHDDLEVICGTSGPEDLELTPDGRFLIVSQFAMGGTGAGLTLFDPIDRSFTPMATTADRRVGWGELACPGPMTQPVASRGISLGTHPSGVPALYVVNHGGRETIEMFELRPADARWELVWHGCAVGSADYNDVAILPDGGYVATRPTALGEEGGGGNLFGGQPSGNVARWTSEGGEEILPNTEAAYPNGVVADPDGRYAYIAAWTGRQIRKYDLESGTQLEIVDLDFMPDNITWTPEGGLLAAGIAGLGAQGGFGVAEIDPATLTVTKVYEAPQGAAPITGVSVALEADGEIYIGAYQGDRLVRIDR